MTVQRAIRLFLAARKASGYPTAQTAQRLNSFCKMVGSHRQLDGLRPEEVCRFIERGFRDRDRPLSGGWDARYYTLRKFYRFALARRLTSKVALPATRPKSTLCFRPYIYSPSELERLLAACDERGVKWNKLHPSTFRTLALLLYGAGLRLGEALRLRHADIDLSGRLLTLRQSKFGKTRFVPIGSDLAQILQKYLRSAAHPHRTDSSAPLFTYQDGQPVKGQAVRRAFIRCRAKAGIARSERSTFEPRLHDLRATFAVHRLTSWYQQGQDVQKLLPMLSTYLGHTSIRATQVYLTMTPQLLGQASRRFERFVDRLQVSHA